MQEIEKLILTAESAMNEAVAPFSKFQVGAAIVTEDGNVYSGFNIENPSLMLTICAERVALLKAISEEKMKNKGTGKHFRLKAIAIVSGNNEYCFPCGTCRQMLMELAPGISIYLKARDGLKKFTIEELLPRAFINRS